MKNEVSPETDWETVPCILIFRMKTTDLMMGSLEEFFQNWLNGELSQSVGTQYASGFWRDGKQIGWSMGFSGPDSGDVPNDPELLKAYLRSLSDNEDPFNEFPKQLASELEGFCHDQGWKVSKILFGYEEASGSGKGIGFGENDKFVDIFE